MKNRKVYRKILLVDDDVDDRKFFSDVLQEIDPSIECVTAKDGRLAMEMLTSPGFVLPDCIFLDLRMPRYNGRQFLQSLKADERLSNIPSIIYTTSSKVSEAEDLHQMGAVHFITKPHDTDEIYYIISSVLEENWEALNNT